jgi:hypothetical protein
VGVGAISFFDFADSPSPLLGGFEAEFIKSNTVTPQCGGQCNQLEVRVKTKASPVQEVIKKLLGS